jgi:SAM-dependent methyltransferase
MSSTQTQADHTQERRWDHVIQEWPSGPPPLWRRQSDMVNEILLDRWLPATDLKRLLKTDLFDELAGEGLYQPLRRRAERVTGIDISTRAVSAARKRYPELEAIEADARYLPFPDAHFDAALSPSTLDHLRDRAEVATALADLHRVLRPRGRLIITLDNPVNPLIALRNVLPDRLAARLRRVPYGTGWTCGPKTLRELLEEAGFEVRDMTAVLHVPRIAVARLERLPMRGLRAGERLGRLPTRYLTGHFVAALAIRP